METSMFRLLTPNREKLLAYGFSPEEESLCRSIDICGAQFRLSVTVTADGEIRTRLDDNATGEEYTLHLTDACGAFVGAVRTACEEILTDIAEKCFDRQVFKSESARRAIEYVRVKYGVELEFLWPKVSDNAVWRRSDSGKWFGALLTVSAKKLGRSGEKGDGDDRLEILDLRIDPQVGAALFDNRSYFPGYHMNKKHWLTIVLDGSVSAEEIFGRIDRSYDSATK